LTESATAVCSAPRGRLVAIADALVAAVAVSLPWSTSATGILIGLWLISLIPVVTPADVRRQVHSAAGGLPLLLWTLGALGMLWADATWSERLAGLSGFHKLLVIPLLLAQFRAGGQARWAILGFLASAVVLLLVSWWLALAPGLTWRGRTTGVPGVPVKDYVMQSAIFTICACGLLWQAAELWATRTALALALLLGAALFAANVVYVAAARTILVVFPVLLLLFGWRRFGWKGVLGVALVGGILAGAIWASSPYLRERVATTIGQMRTVGSGNITPVSLRLEYWRRSLEFVAEAPIVGHGTETIAKLFRRDVAPDTDPQFITDNPHNQLLTVAIQLGLIGVVVLVALWVAHLTLFRERGLVSWLGLIVVVENVVGSLFNSFLFDFGHGWLYVLAVGTLGGVALGHRPTALAGDDKP
jgi:O-antigen ligase